MPFILDAMVVLPDHLHLLMTLPADDHDYVKRISCLKGLFSRQIPTSEFINESRTQKGERGIWQRWYWDESYTTQGIRDELDYQRHVDYIHYNPIKHGHALKVSDWLYSTFHQQVRRGAYALDWASEGGVEFEGIGESDV